jgi:hypothetical protein
VFPNLKSFGVALCVLTMTCLVNAQSPALSASFFSADILQLSWPSNFTTAGWRLESTTNDLASALWQPVPMAPFASNNSLAVFLPIASSRSYYRLQKTGGGGTGGASCVFHATPPVINPGGSSTLSWCPQPGYTYRVSPAPGIVTGGTLEVTPTKSTVYSLTASNALGAVNQGLTTIICNPCGWLQLSNVDVVLLILYFASPSTPSYDFNIAQNAMVTFHLHLQSATATDAYFYGFATGDLCPALAQ